MPLHVAYDGDVRGHDIVSKLSNDLLMADAPAACLEPAKSIEVKKGVTSMASEKEEGGPK
ncbi:hypothetical protein HanRHA438_Chr01g0034821 [Helianthus annuus]|nr:hypothetical protein HanRHA438_Chr01g0034821 [Helianthus annuus]